MRKTSLICLLTLLLVASGCTANIPVDDDAHDSQRGSSGQAGVSGRSGASSGLSGSVAHSGSSRPQPSCGLVACQPCPPDTRPVLDGSCCGKCVPIPTGTCGNARIEVGEMCDDGNRVSGDGCETDCTLTQPPPRCMDIACALCPRGTVQVDDGTCCGTCIRGSACGNGVLEAGEVCDDGNVLGGDGCSADCTKIEFKAVCPTPGVPCVVTPPCGELPCPACAPGTSKVHDGSCCGSCRTQGACGNGIVDPGETCDDGRNDGTLACTPDCQLIPPPPACDPAVGPCPIPGSCAGRLCTTCAPGTRHVADGTCCGRCLPTVIARCGNGLVERGEECDDGNLVANDGCSSLCRIEVSFK